MVFDECPWGSGEVDLSEQATSLGSYAVADEALPLSSDVTMTAWIHLTSIGRGATIFGWLGSGGPCSLAVQDGVLGVSGPTGFAPSAVEVRERQWMFVGVALRSGTVTVLGSHWGRTGGPLVETVAATACAVSAPWLRVGSPADDRGGDLDGLVSGIRVDAVALDPIDLMAVMNGSAAAAGTSWDMGDRRDPDRVCASTTPAADLQLRNAPTWSALVPPSPSSDGVPVVGAGSVHFHTDDLDDCRWPAVHTIHVPDGAPPGLFAVVIDDGTSCEEVPFVVSGSAEVALLVPTLTWQAYGNLGRSPSVWPGRSHYSLHADGSPVIVTTSRRPCPTISPHARLEVEGGDGFAAQGAVVTHLMMADLYAWHWLESVAGAPGAIDDRQLHREGAEALAGVRVLVLSAHPEYWTQPMLDALDTFVGDGGSVIYLGGNGLYWVTSLHPSTPHLMEVRRWGGSQTCSVEPGDREHQYEPLLGGLWADAGRPPSAAVSVGFAGFGAGCLEFTRTEAGRADEWAWVFEGVDAEVFGSEGINAGAGNEFDSFEPGAPSPGVSTVLATALPGGRDHFATFESRAGRAPSAGVRGDVVMTRTPAGGLILAVGSITASSCLVVQDGPAPLRRLCTNALRAMLEQG